MKALKRIILVIAILLFALIIVFFFFIGHTAKKGLPDYATDIRLKGLTDSVSVFRDSLGIPHIYARNECDLYMVTGYLLAEDRLWQMDLLRRVTLGRLSEIFGDDFIETDLLLRSLNFSEKSKNLLSESDSNIVAALVSFSEGVNRFIEDHRGKYPPEFTILGYKPDPWEPVHSLNLIGYMAWDLKSGWSELLLDELGTKVDSNRQAELLPDMLIQKTCVFRGLKAWVWIFFPGAITGLFPAQKV